MKIGGKEKLVQGEWELGGVRTPQTTWLFPQLIPMIGFICLGMGSAGLYLLRLALRSPDVW